MRLGRFLFQNGFTRTLARKSGNINQLVQGSFNPAAAFGDGGPHTLLTRYGLVREETAGSVQGEAANVDPDIIVRWLADPQGGGSVIPQTTSINRPDQIDVHDLRYISRDGQNTAFGELIMPWLGGENGGPVVTPKLRVGEIVQYLDPGTGFVLPAIAYGTSTGESLLRVLRPKAVGGDFDVSATADAERWHRAEA